MRAWRALKASGAAVLRDGVYLIPETVHNTQCLTRVEHDIEDTGGTAYLLKFNGDNDYEFTTLFDRTLEYNQLAEEITECGNALQTTDGSALSRRVRKLRNTYESLIAIDFFKGEAQRQVDALLTTLERQLAVALSSDEPTGKSGAAVKVNPDDFKDRLWATRKNLWVDRLASAWLIRRFIDQRARFAWLDAPVDCPSDAVGFDYDGATFSHVETPSGLLVTFETLMTSFGLTQDRALHRLAQIVHCLDVGGLGVAEAAGFERILHGIRARSDDDDRLLRSASIMFDDIYLAFQEEEKAV
ncbi:MAG: chromate resistance protein [marine bacterium B5-7]|nr:MAG: chromate resistance protein [marine bacterium B5-7]